MEHNWGENVVVFDLLTQRCQNHFSSFTGFFNIQAVAFLQAQESRGVFFGGGGSLSKNHKFS